MNYSNTIVVLAGKSIIMFFSFLFPEGNFEQVENVCRNYEGTARNLPRILMEYYKRLKFMIT